MTKKEKTLVKYKDIWKATVRVPEMETANTKFFKSKRIAKEWLNQW